MGAALRYRRNSSEPGQPLEVRGGRNLEEPHNRTLADGSTAWKSHWLAYIAPGSRAPTLPNPKKPGEDVTEVHSFQIYGPGEPGQQKLAYQNNRFKKPRKEDL